MPPLIFRNEKQQPVSRRDFLKLAGAGLFGLALGPLPGMPRSLPSDPALANLPTLSTAALAGLPALSPARQGRVIDGRVNLYQEPSFSSKVLRSFWKDVVLAISEVTIGDVEPAHNRVWYRIGEQGYVHSGAIQPVATVLNEPVSFVPETGFLAEVTVPFTDAHRGAPDRNFPVAYRYYYHTTHWIIGVLPGPDGEAWYHVLEDKWDNEYYVMARHLRPVPEAELAPLSPDLPLLAKRLEVRTQEQAVIAYEFDQPVFMTRAATGAKFSNGDFSTPAGRHTTFHKRPSRHMAAGNLAFNGYDLPGVPWITYFTPSGISFHGTYWHNNYGRPRSHGCVNLTPEAAKWIYRWTVPVVPPTEQDVYEEFGTAVDVIG